MKTQLFNSVILWLSLAVLTVSGPGSAAPNAFPGQSVLAALDYTTYLGGSGDEVANSLAAASADDIYVAGHTASPDFAAPGRGERDAFVARLRANGSPPQYLARLGGSSLDEAYAVAMDNSGNAYLAGCTDSPNFPTRNAQQPTYAVARDNFVAKLDADGRLVYSTFPGGSSTDEAFALAVDKAGAVYITGRTFSADFPISDNAPQRSKAGGYDAFIAKLNASGRLVYSTYLGGTQADKGRGLTVDRAGAVYVTGHTGSDDFPVRRPRQPKVNGDDAFVAKLNAAGNRLVYSTYLGGNGGDWGSGIAVDSRGNAYVVGRTASLGFPRSHALQNAHRGGVYDAFVTVLNAPGNGLVYSTYLGGDGGDEAYGVAADRARGSTLTGHTGSSNFPLAGGLPPAPGGARGAFLVRLLPDGSALDYSLTLGGSAGEAAAGVGLDGVGNAHLAGYTLSTDLPTANPLQATFGGERDAFVVKLSGAAPGPAALQIYLPVVLK